MPQIEFTVMQRFGIETLLNQPTGTISELVTVYEIAKKVTMKDKTSYIKEVGREILMDREAIDNAPVDQIDLDKSECRKLHSLLTEHKGFKQGDMEWILPLKKQLDVAIDSK